MKRQFIINICMSVILAMLPSLAQAQGQKVRGTVLDETGEPVIGATVMIEGQKGSGTVTDLDGN